MTTNEVVHENPIWRERANFIIAARINAQEPQAQWQWEQLWARQITDNRFEICCIPFFVYDLALGDEVETGLEGEERYVVQKVVKQSGHYTFRVWFTDAVARDEVPSDLAHLGCLMEWRWSGSNLLTVNASSHDTAKTVADYLYQREQLGQLEYETGRTR